MSLQELETPDTVGEQQVGYLVRPGYKQTEVGLIPEDWNLVPLRELGSWFSGGTPSKKKQSYWIGEVPWVSPKDMKRSRLYDSIDHISESAVRDGARLLPTGSILIVIRGMILVHSVPVAKAERPLACNQDIKALVPNSHTNSDFILYWLANNSSLLMGLTTESTHGTKRLPPDSLFKTRVPIPKLAEQEAIAVALGDADALVESLERLLAKKRNLKQAAMQQLLTGKKRLPGFEGEWAMKELGDLVECSSSGTYGAENSGTGLTPMPVATTAQITSNDRWNGSPMQTRFFTDAQLLKYCVKMGDLVVVKSSGSAASIQSGKMVFIDDNLAGTFLFSNFLMRLRPFECNAQFLYSYLTSTKIKRIIPSLCEASTYPNIRINEYLEIMVPVPSFEEQTAIATVLSDMESEIAAIEAKIDKARKIKAGMMQELLTGKKRLVPEGSGTT